MKIIWRIVDLILGGIFVYAGAIKALDPVQFANDIDNMLAVDDRSNHDKSSMTPDRWRPRRSYWCAYAIRWTVIKHRYGLWVTAPEKAALAGMLSTCPAR